MVKAACVLVGVTNMSGAGSLVRSTALGIDLLDSNNSQQWLQFTAMIILFKKVCFSYKIWIQTEYMTLEQSQFLFLSLLQLIYYFLLPTLIETFLFCLQ